MQCPASGKKYLSAVYIKMSDATWFKKLLFGIALKYREEPSYLKNELQAGTVLCGVPISDRLLGGFPKAERAIRV